MTSYGNWTHNFVSVKILVGHAADLQDLEGLGRNPELYLVSNVRGQ
jgi:hypothetical protein